MKKQFLALSILSFALFSCSNEDEVQSQQSEGISDLEVMNIIRNAKPLSTEEYEKDFLKENNYVLNPVDISTFITPLNTTIQGPFTTTISGTPTGVLPNVKVVWKGDYPAIGTYVADINTHSIDIELPAGAIGFVNSMTNQAYNNWSEQTQGYASSNYTMNGKNYLLIKTYTMKLKWNMAGQTINAFVPYYGWGDKSVSYSYIIP